jgi:hypothetical protein
MIAGLSSGSSQASTRKSAECFASWFAICCVCPEPGGAEQQKGSPGTGNSRVRHAGNIRHDCSGRKPTRW